MEREDGTDTLGGVVPLFGSSADDGQQDGDDLFEAEGTESGQSDDAISRALAGLQFSDEQRQEFVDDDRVLAVAEVAHHVDGEALGGHEAGTASGVHQVRDGDQQRLFPGVGGLNGARFPQVLIHLTFKKEVKFDENLDGMCN